MGQHRPDDIAGAAQVDGHVAVPHFIGGVLKQALPGDAGVVDRQGDRTQLCLHSTDHGVHSFAVGHVGLNSHGILSGSELPPPQRPPAAGYS